MPGVRALTRPRFLLAAALAGVAAGLIGIAMALLLEFFEALFYGVAHGGLLEHLAAARPGGAYSPRPWAASSPVACGGGCAQPVG